MFWPHWNRPGRLAGLLIRLIRRLRTRDQPIGDGLKFRAESLWL